MDLLAKALKTGKDIINDKEPEEIIEILEKKKTTLKLGENISEDSVVVIEPKTKKKTKKLAMSSTKPEISFTKKGKKGRIFAFVGKHGTGKSFACCNFARKFGKTLYIDPEYKVSEILDEQYPDLKYDMKEPIIDKNKKHSQIFKKDSDVHIDIAQVINETTGKRDNVASAKYIIDNTPLYIQLIKSGKYKNFIIDSCTPIWEYALKTWLKKERKKNPKRVRPNKFEWQEIEAIKQDILFPFINYCRIYNVNLILTFGITGHYVNDIKIGYKEDAKEWLLNIFSYELWFEYDYKKYCIKHPYKTFWMVQDEDLNISEYLFDKEFINDNVEYKEFEDFKYESMTSEAFRQETKQRKKSSSLIVG